MRSPNYPTLDLEHTLNAARKIYGSAKRHPAGREVILKALGYDSDSGASRSVLASLRAFGLLEMQAQGENRNGKLTEVALDVLMDERPDSTERGERLRELALTPKIHREVWDKYQGSLPDDAVAKFWLMRERGFTESGAKDFLKQFRATVAFAGLGDAPATPRGSEGKSATPLGNTPASSASPSASSASLEPNASTEVTSIPLKGGGRIVLEMPLPLKLDRLAEAHTITSTITQHLKAYLALDKGPTTSMNPSSSGD